MPLIWHFKHQNWHLTFMKWFQIEKKHFTGNFSAIKHAGKN